MPERSKIVGQYVKEQTEHQIRETQNTSVERLQRMTLSGVVFVEKPPKKSVAIYPGFFTFEIFMGELRWKT